MISFIIIFLMITFTSFSNTLKIVMPKDLPPYIIKEASGFEYEIVEKALKLAGYEIEVIYMPFGRLSTIIEDMEYDGVSTVGNENRVKGIFYSKPYITYENVAIGLKSNEFVIENIDDLLFRSIIAFKDARLYLGRDYANMAENNSDYKEIANQEGQVASLYSKRVDIIILDRNIYLYHLINSDLIRNKEEVIYFELFEPSHYSMVFKEKRVRDAFDKGIEKLKQEGLYDEIIEKYIIYTLK